MREEFIDLEEIIRNSGLYYAHSKESEKQEIQYETLEDHVKRCRFYFIKICKSKRLETKLAYFYHIYMETVLEKASAESKSLFDEMWRNIITFHDTGKINPLFQKNVLHRKDIEEKREYHIVGKKHSVLSAVLYMDYYLKKAEKLESIEEAERLLVIILCNAYIISRHHSSLIPIEDFLKGNQNEEIRKAITVMEQMQKDVCREEFTLDSDCLEAMEQLFKDIKRSKKQNIWLYWYMKLTYSVLVAADYYATSEYSTGVKIQDFGEIGDISELYRVFESTEINKGIREYESTIYPMKNIELKKTEDINILRREIFLDAERELDADWDKSIFYLEAPTGSGKSNLSMNLSFQLMQKNNDLKKIYYVYPFNTLIEQNQEILERTFESAPQIMEKIATLNSITPIKRVMAERNEEEHSESGSYYEKALLNRQFLNYPLILTTHVSLFDTIFGDSKESAFGFHQLVGSILVLDEIQSYRNEIWGEIITFLTELAEFLHIKVIIMSATLPDLEELKERSDRVSYLIRDRNKFFQHSCFKDRVTASRELLDRKMTMELLLEHVVKQCDNEKKIVIEFIRKGSAEEFYQRLITEERVQEAVLCMTGDDSILERKQIIKRIKEERGIILVSTQVIEAGIDIDMDIGYKAIAKMDSEEQFMGRINRSYTHNRKGIVYFFQMDEPKKIYKYDIRANRELGITKDKIWEYMESKNFVDYYKLILDIWQKNYKANSETAVYEGVLKALDFPRIKQKMQLIAENNWNVSVYLGRVIRDEHGNKVDGRKLWESYKQLLYDNEMNYAERKVKLSEITAKMNYFIYQVQQVGCTYDEQIGELFYIEDGEEYIENGRLNRAKIVGQLTEFI